MSILTPQRPAQPTARTDAAASSSAAAVALDHADQSTRDGRLSNGRAPSEPVPTGWFGVPIRVWWMAGLLLATFVGVYWTSLWRLWRKTNPINGTDDWPHAVFIPIVGLYYLFLNLDELLKTPAKPLLGQDFTRNRIISAGLAIVGGLAVWKLALFLPSSIRVTYGPPIGALGVGAALLGTLALICDWGLGTLIGGLLTYAYGVHPGRNDFVKDVGMVMSVFGMVLTLGGWRIMRIAWFPCVFLLFALPWPGLFFSKVAGPLQHLAAQVAVGVMSIFGVDVVNEGVKIVINKPGVAEPRILNVAEACAGLRGLMTFVSLGAAIAFLSARPLWQKLIITFAGVPIAIFCNVLRVSGQGLLDYYVDERWSSGFAHQFAGIVLLLPGFLILLGVVWVLDKLFVEEDETVAAGAATAKPTTAGGAA